MLNLFSRRGAASPPQAQTPAARQELSRWVRCMPRARWGPLAAVAGDSHPWKEDAQGESHGTVRAETGAIVDAAKNGHVPEQVRAAAEDGVKARPRGLHQPAARPRRSTQTWKRMMHADFETVREMERICCQIRRLTLTPRSQRPAPWPPLAHCRRQPSSTAIRAAAVERR